MSDRGRGHLCLCLEPCRPRVKTRLREALACRWHSGHRATKVVAKGEEGTVAYRPWGLWEEQLEGAAGVRSEVWEEHCLWEAQERSLGQVTKDFGSFEEELQATQKLKNTARDE